MLDLLAAKVVVGCISSTEIAGEAYDALDDVLISGYPGRADTLLELATTADLSVHEAHGLLKKSFFEMGKSWPSREEAVTKLVTYWLELITSRTLDPRNGMCELRNSVLHPSGVLDDCKTYVGDSIGMERLIGAYYAYDDIQGTPNTDNEPLMPPEDATREIDEWIVELAQDWLDQHAGVAGQR